MTIYTFTPGDTVDPRVVYSASADAITDSIRP